MGRQAKKGLDYSPWNTDILECDTKIDELLEAQGWAGFSIYFYLCQKAYASDGYFYRWSYANAATTARRMGGGIGSETVKQTVDICCRIGLFESRLFGMGGILTSKGIQRRYADAIAKRNCREVKKSIWLLDDAETKKFGITVLDDCGDEENYFLSGNPDFLPENPDFLSGNPDSLSGNAHKSKVKESKVEKSKEEESRGKESKGKSAPSRTTRAPKSRYGEYQNVMLTDRERELLVNDYGEEKTHDAIRLLDEYIEEKGTKYKSHYLTMKRWVFDALNERHKKEGGTPPGGYDWDSF